MRTFGTIMLAAAAGTVMVTAAGSAQAADTTTRLLLPSPVMSQHSTDYQDDLTGCGARHGLKTQPAGNPDQAG